MILQTSFRKSHLTNSIGSNCSLSLLSINNSKILTTIMRNMRLVKASFRLSHLSNRIRSSRWLLSININKSILNIDYCIHKVSQDSESHQSLTAHCLVSESHLRNSIGSNCSWWLVAISQKLWNLDYYIRNMLFQKLSLGNFIWAPIFGVFMMITINQYKLVNCLSQLYDIVAHFQWKWYHNTVKFVSQNDNVVW